eukprot:ANDGO_00853.mRNA.1 Adenosine kinase 2
MSVTRVFGMCNPLLDISAEVDNAFLEKYGLQAGNQILAEPNHIPMYAELANMTTVEYIAGGAGQNSIRVCQWMLQTPGATYYTGSVGNDAFGEQLEKKAQEAGVTVLYSKTSEAPTGTCAVCVVNKERSLVANLAAANLYKASFLESELVKKAVQDAGIFYVTGFFLTVAPEGALSLAQHAAEKNKIFAVNLSAPFVCQFFGQHLEALLPYTDFVFGNENEAAAMATKLGIDGSDLEKVAVHIAKMPKANASRPRYVIFTQGSKASIVACSSTDAAVTHAVPKIDSEKIVDTNGAGDAFVGGFLSQIAKGKSIEESVNAGHYAAGVIIQRSGCTFPATPDAHYLQ